LPQILQHHVTDFQKGDMKSPKQNNHGEKKCSVHGFSKKSVEVLLFAFLGL